MSERVTAKNDFLRRNILVFLLTLQSITVFCIFRVWQEPKLYVAGAVLAGAWIAWIPTVWHLCQKRRLFLLIAIVNLAALLACVPDVLLVSLFMIPGMRM